MADGIIPPMEHMRNRMPREEPETDGGPSGDAPATSDSATTPPPATSDLPTTSPPTNLPSSTTTQSSGDKSMADGITSSMKESSISEDVETDEPLGADPATSVTTPPPETLELLATPPTNHPSSATTQSSGDESKAGMFISLVNNMATDLVQLKLGSLKIPSNYVAFIYNPLEYAKETHDCFVKKYGNSTKSVLFLGMNPDSHGTAQNGVPFGETSYVKDWLKITGNVDKPPDEHDNHVIEGLGYTGRKSVSGERFWKLCKDQCGTPENFFKECFVYDYCPLMFLDGAGANITPPRMSAGVRNLLTKVCDDYLYKIIQLLGVKVVVGIGKFAEARTKKALEKGGVEGVRVVTIMHPSPINPAANEGWQNNVEKTLKDLDLMKYMK